jgi:hypothetical protein
MNLKPSQFTITRILHATVWFALAAALLGLMLREDSVPNSRSDLSGWLMPVTFVAIGIGGGVLFGWQAVNTSVGRSVAGMYCGAASIFLKIFSRKFAWLAGFSIIAKDTQAAHMFAAVSDAFSISSMLFAVAAVIFALLAMREGRRYVTLAAVTCSAIAFCLQFLIL